MLEDFPEGSGSLRGAGEIFDMGSCEDRCALGMNFYNSVAGRYVPSRASYNSVHLDRRENASRVMLFYRRRFYQVLCLSLAANP